MASDRQNDGDVLAMNGASAPLWHLAAAVPGPAGFGAARARSTASSSPSPPHDELEDSDLDLIVSGTKDAVLMIEGFAREMPEDEMVEAIMDGPRLHRRAVRPAAGAGREGRQPQKMEFQTPPADGLVDEARRSSTTTTLKAAKQTEGKQARAEAVQALKEAGHGRADSRSDGRGRLRAKARSSTAWHDLEAKVDPRPDPRRHAARRPRQQRRCATIDCEVDLLPRVHGSALFQRGETQALVTVTLGTGRDEQRVDGLVEEYSQEVHARLQLPAVLGRRVPPDPRPGPPRDRPRRAGRAERQARCCPTPTSSPTRSASSPTSSSRTAPARWPASAAPRWA